MSASLQDELVLIVPRDHQLAAAGVVPKDALYSLTFVFLNTGSSVQLAQEATLRRQGILWRRLKIDMVRFTSASACHDVLSHLSKYADESRNIK